MPTLAWHAVPGYPQFDFSQPGELGANYGFACELGQGRAEAIAHGYGYGAEVATGESGNNMTVYVRRLTVKTTEGADEVSIFAATADYSEQIQARPPDYAHSAGDEEWTIRFAMNRVPGDQIVGIDGSIPAGEEVAPEVLMPQPSITLQSTKWLAKTLPSNLTEAIDMAQTYSAAGGGNGTFEANAPKVCYTLKGQNHFLCVAVEIEKDDDPSLLARVAQYEYAQEAWAPAAAYPEGNEQ